MALSRVGGTTGSTDAANTDVTLTLPVGTTTGDVVLVFGACSKEAPDGTFGDVGMVTAGYSQVGSTDGATYGHARLWRKVMGGTPDTQAVGDGDNGTLTPNYGYAYLMEVWRGADTGTPEDAAATVDGTEGGGTSNPDGAAITPVTNGAQVFSFCMLPGPFTITTPSGYTDFQTKSQTGGARGVTVAGASMNKASAGAEDPPAFGGDANWWRTITYALRPAAVAAGQPMTKRLGGVRYSFNQAGLLVPSRGLW